jgi:hypothetical protein
MYSYSLLDAYGAQPPPPPPPPTTTTRWDEAPKLPPWLINDPYDPSEEYFKQRDPKLPLSLVGESTRNYRSKSDLYNSKTPIRYVVYADGHGCQTTDSKFIRPICPSVFLNYIGEKSSGINAYQSFENLLGHLNNPTVHQPYAPLQGHQFLYLVHLFRMSSSVAGSPITVNLPQHADDMVPDLFLFAPGQISVDDIEHEHVIRNPSIFAMLDTQTGEIINLGAKYLIDAYDKKVVGTTITSPAYTMHDGRMVQLSDVYDIIRREISERHADMNQVALILQACRVAPYGATGRASSPGPSRYMGGKKKQRRRQTRNRNKKGLSKKSKRSKKHSHKQVDSCIVNHCFIQPWHGSLRGLAHKSESRQYII